MRLLPKRGALAGVAGVLTLGAMLLAGCGGGTKEGQFYLTLVNESGKTAVLQTELADNPQTMERGLSGRTSLPRDAGMLFIITVRGPGFWMKDTLIPLSVAFIGDCGEIVALADMEPQTLDLHSTHRPYKFGLEVNKGWFAQHNIGVGDKVRIPPPLAPGCPIG